MSTPIIEIEATEKLRLALTSAADALAFSIPADQINELTILADYIAVARSLATLRAAKVDSKRVCP
jgi:hypothetical protein